MIVVRFKVRCQPDRTDEMLALMRDVVVPSRALAGVVHFDVARDVTEPDALLAVEVFDDRDAMDRQEAQPEVAKVMELMESGVLDGPPEWTVFEVVAVDPPAD